MKRRPRRLPATQLLTARMRVAVGSAGSLNAKSKQFVLTSVKLQATLCRVRIRNFVHKGLPPETVDKLRKMLAFLDDMQDPEELRALAAWRVHTLTGDRKGTWSLSVTRNRRLTFHVDIAEREIYDVNLEDYH